MKNKSENQINDEGSSSISEEIEADPNADAHLYTRIVNGITVLGNWIDNPDGTSTVQVDMTDDAVEAWEKLYKMPISKGFNKWFNTLISKALKAKGY